MARSISPRQPAYEYVGVVRARITNRPATTVTDFGRLPAYASIIGGGVHILTGFDGSGTDTIDVGFRGGSATADPNGLATIMDLTNVGFIVLDELAATTNIINTSPIILTYNYNDQNADSTTGVAYISVLYTCGPTDGS